MGEITLKPIENTDLDLINRWLNKEHVLRWYHDTDDWMNEIRNRHGAFCFIRHFIALSGRRPIGFCQYYDCFEAKEDWYEVGEEGTVYSIDYLIGEEDFLCKGYGKAIVMELERIIRAETTSKRIIVQPEEANAASCGTLLSCGYRFDSDRQYYDKNLQMEIAFASADDIEGWMEMLELVKDNFPGLDMDEYKKGLSERIHGQGALVARENGTVTGGLMFSRDSKELEFLAVHPQYRGQGVATALIRRMFDLFPKGSCFTVITYREDDTQGKAARELYKKIGFTPGELVTVYDYPCQEFIYLTE